MHILTYACGAFGRGGYLGHPVEKGAGVDLLVVRVAAEPSGDATALLPRHLDADQLGTVPIISYRRPTRPG